MPFTLAHIAAAPPLWRLANRRLVLSALVVGAMAPDFEYMVQLSPQRTMGHTPVGVVVLCVPASLVTLGVWHRLVGPAFAKFLPGGWGRAAGRPFRFGPFPRLLAISASAAIGAYSHLAWDAFTHAGSPVVQRFDVFMRPVWRGGPSLFVLLWYGSGALGMLLVSGWLARMGRSAGGPEELPRTPETRRERRRTFTTLGGGAAALAVVNALRQAADGGSAHQVVVAGVLGAMSGTALAAVVAGARLRARAGQAPPTRRPAREAEDTGRSSGCLAPRADDQGRETERPEGLRQIEDQRV